MPDSREPPPAADVVDAGFPGMKRIADSVLNSTFDNSNRRQIGQGIVGSLMQRAYRRSRIDSHVQMQIDKLDDHR